MSVLSCDSAVGFSSVACTSVLGCSCSFCCSSCAPSAFFSCFFSSLGGSSFGFGFGFVRMGLHVEFKDYKIYIVNLGCFMTLGKKKNKNKINECMLSRSYTCTCSYLAKHSTLTSLACLICEASTGGLSNIFMRVLAFCCFSYHSLFSFKHFSTVFMSAASK